MFTMRKNQIAEGTRRQSFRLTQILLIHFRTNIATSCNVCLVHLCVVKRFIRHDNQMGLGETVSPQLYQ